MAFLPSHLPTTYRNWLADTLAQASIELGPVKAGTRLTHTVVHRGATWELTYVGSMGGDPMWRLAGTGYEHGLLVDVDEARDIIRGR